MELQTSPVQMLRVRAQKLDLEAMPVYYHFLLHFDLQDRSMESDQHYLCDTQISNHSDKAQAQAHPHPHQQHYVPLTCLRRASSTSCGLCMRLYATCEELVGKVRRVKCQLKYAIDDRLPIEHNHASTTYIRAALCSCSQYLCLTASNIASWLYSVVIIISRYHQSIRKAAF